jgi:hypothetical protein
VRESKGDIFRVARAPFWAFRSILRYRPPSVRRIVVPQWRDTLVDMTERRSTATSRILVPMKLRHSLVKEEVHWPSRRSPASGDLRAGSQAPWSGGCRSEPPLRGAITSPTQNPLMSPKRCADMLTCGVERSNATWMATIMAIFHKRCFASGT